MIGYRKNLHKDNVVLVTGGRSGIGYGIAKMYLQLGATVIICSRKEDLLHKACQELSIHGKCLAKACDIREEDQVNALAEFIKDEVGKLDILINNAGGQFPSLAEDINAKGWSAVINNNLNGTFYVARQMFKSFFKPQQRGNIVNITANVHRGFPGMVHTGAARAGVENLTKTLALEWSKYNVRINAVAPGTIESSGLDTYHPLIQKSFAEQKEANLMNRFGTVEDIANAVVFLSSPLSSYISGITVYVDGLDHLAQNNMGFIEVIEDIKKEMTK